MKTVYCRYLILFFLLCFLPNLQSAVWVEESPELSRELILKKQHKKLKKKLKHRRGKKRKGRFKAFVKKVKNKLSSFWKKLQQDEVRGDYRKTEIFSLLSFLFLLVPFFGSLGAAYAVLGAICAILSPIFAIIGLIRINNAPHRYKGKVWAILTLILIALFLFLIALLIIIFLSY